MILITSYEAAIDCRIKTSVVGAIDAEKAKSLYEKKGNKLTKKKLQKKSNLYKNLYTEVTSNNWTKYDVKR